MTGSRTIPVRLTIAQWDVLLAALERAEAEWRVSEGQRDRIAGSNVRTLLRAREALESAWEDGSRMMRP